MLPCTLRFRKLSTSPADGWINGMDGRMDGWVDWTSRTRRCGSSIWHTGEYILGVLLMVGDAIGARVITGVWSALYTYTCRVLLLALWVDGWVT